MADRQRRRCLDVFTRLSMLGTEVLRGQPLLDIGCDTGTFLKSAQEAFGIIPFGLDVNKRAIETAREQGIHAYAMRIEEAPEELHDFPLVTAIDVIEHVSDPAAFLVQLRERLRPGGLAYLETPNIRSMVYRFGQSFSNLTGGRPAGLFDRLFPPQHVQYFTPSSFRALAQGAGFNIVRLDCRILPSTDIAASLPARIAIAALQTTDLLLRTEILIWCVLQRPLTN